MRKADAPKAGWYPDPQQRARLRWWDGLDWSDIRRAPPSEAELIAAEENRAFFEANEKAALAARQPPAPGTGALNRQQGAQLVEEVRMAARQEIDRAAGEFSRKATTAVRDISPLISQYTSQAAKWVRRAVILAIVLFVGYILLQIFVQQSALDWLGDRIDNLTEETAPFGVDSDGAGPDTSG